MRVMVFENGFVDMRHYIRPGNSEVPYDKVYINKKTIMHKDEIGQCENVVCISELSAKGNILTTDVLPKEWFDGLFEKVCELPITTGVIGISYDEWLGVDNVCKLWTGKNMNDLIKDNFFPDTIYVLSYTSTTISLLMKKILPNGEVGVSLIIIDSLEGLIHRVFTLSYEDFHRVCENVPQLDEFF